MLILGIQFFGGRGSGGKSGARGARGGGGRAGGDKYRQMEAQYGKEYAENERRIDKLERELLTEMSSTETRHSIGWRRNMQAEIDRLRDRNAKIAWG